ncbi:epsilon subunit of F1F0-ATP synthase N-terminal domain-containing protein [Sanghuangporus baumii]|uniref:ATP synthase subunit delta, mitochondrial n=1 Tax=Sanghuangporus baumii TaxID=108892 RepID=A0A9Q5I2W9_SANBA|nr:epsilon subunit of F1F0-ATP synthase N-terminal domain-containing protein [Sanghuangporus baumii]
MSALRLISSAARSVPRATSALQRRGYAEAADKIKLSLVLPHQTIFASTDVVQVNLSAATGDMGILANHVPSIEPLRPGVVEVIDSGNNSQKWFVSGGFANVHPNNKLTINAVEAAPLEHFSLEVRPSLLDRGYQTHELDTKAVRANLAEAQRIAGGNASEEDKAEAQIEINLYESLQHALSK